MPTALPGTRRVEQIMGMPIVVDVRDDDVDDGPLERVFGWLRSVDATFSTYRDDSVISRLRRGETTREEAPPDVRSVLDRCDELRVETDGYFDAHYAGRLDPSGLVKGWAVDRAAQILDEAGIANYAVNAGGDIRLRGAARPDAAWRVGIQHPLSSREVAAVVVGTDLAVATSGEYARGTHVLDPHSGEPPDGTLSVTFTGPDLATADAYATAAFAMGGEGPRWAATRLGYESLTITTDRRVLVTPGFPRG